MQDFPEWFLQKIFVYISDAYQQSLLETCPQLLNVSGGIPGQIFGGILRDIPGGIPRASTEASQVTIWSQVDSMNL